MRKHEDLANCKRSTLKIWRVVKFSNQNLTRRKNFNSKSNALYLFKFKIWRVVFFFQFEIWHVMKFSIQNHAFSKKHEKCKLCLFHGVKWAKTWFFERKYFLKIWHFEKIFIQNLTRCNFLNSKSNPLYFFKIKIWRVMFFYFKIWQVGLVFLRNPIFILFLRLWPNENIFSQR